MAVASLADVEAEAQHQHYYPTLVPFQCLFSGDVRGCRRDDEGATRVLKSVVVSFRWASQRWVAFLMDAAGRRRRESSACCSPRLREYLKLKPNRGRLWYVSQVNPKVGCRVSKIKVHRLETAKEVQRGRGRENGRNRTTLTVSRDFDSRGFDGTLARSVYLFWYRRQSLGAERT